MKKKFRTLSYLIFTLVVVCVITGCTSKEQGSSSEGSNKPDDAPYNIVMAYLSTAENKDTQLIQDEINKITQEKINATVELKPIGFSAWEQQYNLLLTSGEKVDLIFSYGGGAYVTSSSKGAYLPLDELLKTHGQDILEVVPDYFLEGTKLNGEIYGIPSLRDFSGNSGFLMRQDIVDKHAIDLSKVKSFEDFGSVFEVVKEKEPSLTPIVNSGTTVTPVKMMLTDKYDNLGDSLGVVAFNGEDEIVNLFETPEYVEAVELVHNWYKNRYVKKDAATTQELTSNIIKAGKGFGNFATMRPGFENQEELATGMDITTVPITEAVITSNAAVDLNMSIVRNSENPEKTMEFLNLLYSDKEIMNLLALGIEGKHYELTPEGTAKLVPDSEYIFNAWEIGNNYLTYPYEGNSPDFWNEIQAFDQAAKVSPALGFQFDPSSVKTEIAATTNVLNQYRAGLEHGVLDPEKTLPEFNEQLKAAGLDKIIAEKQKQYNEWRTNKK